MDFSLSSGYSVVLRIYLFIITISVAPITSSRSTSPYIRSDGSIVSPVGFSVVADVTFVVTTVVVVVSDVVAAVEAVVFAGSTEPSASRLLPSVLS